MAEKTPPNPVAPEKCLAANNQTCTPRDTTERFCAEFPDSDCPVRVERRRVVRADCTETVTHTRLDTGAVVLPPFSKVPCPQLVEICGQTLHPNAVHWCEQVVGAAGSSWSIIYKGSSLDFVNAGGVGTDRGLVSSAAGAFADWLYATVCSVTQPDPVDGYEWFVTPVNPIGVFAVNGGSTYGPVDSYAPSGNAAPTCGGSSVCREGKAWYSEATRALVGINTLDGQDVTASIDPINLREGACPIATEKDRLICAFWTGATDPADTVERTYTSECGEASIKYFNPATSPMVEVTIESVVRGSECRCCDYPEPPVTEISAPLQTEIKEKAESATTTST